MRAWLRDAGPDLGGGDAVDIDRSPGEDLCRSHHRHLHERHPGVIAKLEPDGTFHVIDETGRERITHPPPHPRR